MTVDGPQETTEEGVSEPRYGKIRAQLESTELSRHPALFYRTPSEQLAVVTAYVRQGLEADELCLYFADEHDPGEVRDHFESVGLDVEAHEHAGRLRIESATETYLEDGFDVEETITAFERAARDSVENGYAGLRAAGENTWSFEVEGSFDEVLDFEVCFDERCRDVPTTALCQYSLERFDDETIGKVLQTHEQIIYRGRICENPYYVPPAEYFERGRPRENSRLMLEQLRRLSRAERDVNAREQRLSVINRVLRHNIRNDMSVLLGHLDELRGELDSDSATESLRTALTVAEEFVALAEKASHVERTLDGVDAEALDLVAVLERITSRVEPATDVTLTRTVPPSTTVVADPDIETGLEELLVGIAEEVDREVALAVTVHDRADEEMTDVDVEPTNCSLSDRTRRALTSGGETPLEHSSGIALWVARWIIEASSGVIEVDGDRIRVSLPSVYRP